MLITGTWVPGSVRSGRVVGVESEDGSDMVSVSEVPCGGPTDQGLDDRRP